jgi:fatty acid-binding protein DegV
VRAQHTEQAAEFLVEVLKVCTQKEANQRIFFVSAKEALQACQQEQKGLLADSKNNQACKYPLLAVIITIMGNRRDA